MPAVMRERLSIGVLVWLLAFAGLDATALAGTVPAVNTGQACYVVGSPVGLSGSGFAPHRTYDVTDDGVDFGQAKTNASGGFATHFSPGGLGAGVVQSLNRISVSDGTNHAATRFTLTRQTGARFEASRGDPRRLRAPFQVWGFSLDGSSRALYLHYVSPSGRVRTSVSLGRTSGQCGYLVTRPMRLFPFVPSVGRWTLQVDVSQVYARHPNGPVARIGIVIRRG